MPVRECSRGFLLHLRGEDGAMSEVMEEPEGFENESEDEEIMAPEREHGEGEGEESGSQ